MDRVGHGSKTLANGYHMSDGKTHPINARLLTKNQSLYLHQNVLTVNEVFWAISKAGNGADLEQLSQQTELHTNTLKVICRWLMSKGLIEADRGEGRGGPYTFYALEPSGRRANGRR